MRAGQTEGPGAKRLGGLPGPSHRRHGVAGEGSFAEKRAAVQGLAEEAATRLDYRLFLCARCDRHVAVCSICDRGQIYCEGECARLARQESLQAAGQRYQQTSCGRRLHAARQDRYRERQASPSTQKVTHQGTQGPMVSCRVVTKPSRCPEGSSSSRRRGEILRIEPVGVYCCFCGCLCRPYARHGPLRRRR